MPFATYALKIWHRIGSTSDELKPEADMKNLFLALILISGASAHAIESHAIKLRCISLRDFVQVLSYEHFFDNEGYSSLKLDISEYVLTKTIKGKTLPNEAAAEVDLWTGSGLKNVSISYAGKDGSAKLVVDPSQIKQSSYDGHDGNDLATYTILGDFHVNTSGAKFKEPVRCTAEIISRGMAG
jgi:hypothetical protein